VNKVGDQRPVFDWRWLVVGYCALILFQLFPSYALFGMRRTPVSAMTGIYLIWMGIGVAIVGGYIGSRSKGYPMLESLSIAVLYILTVIGIYRGSGKALLRFVPSLPLKLMYLLLFFSLCAVGVVIGKIARIRREKKASLQT